MLKPRVHDEPVDYLAAVLADVPDTDDLRIARPVAARDGGFVIDGWFATGWLDGAPAPERYDEHLDVSRRFHAAIAHAPPPRAGDTPWDVADRMAWREIAVHAAAEPAAQALAALLGEPLSGVPAQLIHGDVAGNVLFADDLGLPPAVIDLSPNHRPAAYGDAICVADLIAWMDAPVSLAERFIAEQPQAESLLARAVVFRICAAALLCTDDPARVEAERAAYAPVAGLLSRS